jgi:GNAT superfamily N-acetyltransferase
LRKARGALQRAESKARERLPEALGGRFSSDALTLRVLSDEDHAALQALRPPAGRVPNGPRIFVVGALLGDQLIASGACSAVGPSDAAPFEHVLFAADYVAPRFRRRGVARLLHGARLEVAAGRGARVAYAWVDPENHASLAGFRTAGFMEIASGHGPPWLKPPRAGHILFQRNCVGPSERCN